jgi:hypothetical protein
VLALAFMAVLRYPNDQPARLLLDRNRAEWARHQAGDSQEDRACPFTRAS